jgi:hypothetical protein
MTVWRTPATTIHNSSTRLSDTERDGSGRPAAACTAAGITPAGRVLAPSAGTGLLAILAEFAGGSLMLSRLHDHLFAALRSRGSMPL